MNLDFKAIKKPAIFQKFGTWLLFGVVLLVFITQLKSYPFSENQTPHLEKIHFLFLALILVGANWFFEWKKWIIGMKSIHNFAEEVLQKGFYAGMIAGFITPSALGNFLGRMMVVDKDLKPKVVSTTIMGNGAQFLVSIIFGGLSLFFIRDLPQFANSPWIKTIVLWITCFGLILYFLIGKARVFRNFLSKFLPSFVSIDLKLRYQFLLWSGLRYLVFSFQFFLVLGAFLPDLSIEVLFWIWQMYLWTTLSPSLFFGKLFIRETMAIFILANAGIELPIALLASLIIWLMNNALPSLFAYFKWKHYDLVEA